MIPPSISALDSIAVFRRVFGFALFLQSLEMGVVSRRVFFPSSERFRTYCDRTTSPRWSGLIPVVSGPGFLWICVLRGLLALALLSGASSPWIPFLLILLGFLLVFRFGGSFNGGSDAMSFVLLSGLLLLSCNEGGARVQTAGLYWIKGQVVLSYFLSGLRKFGNREWRSGQALQRILRAWPGGRRASFQWIQNSSFVAQIASILILGFQIGFPLVLMEGVPRWIFLMAGVGFHLLNHFIFGLNRFFWVWISAYFLF